MSEFKSKDPLHGVTLERIVTELSERYGWEELGRRIEIRCFLFDPSVKSSLTFLRKTPWARAKARLLKEPHPPSDACSTLSPPVAPLSDRIQPGELPRR